MTGFAPLLLLDEVVAHLDPGAAERRCMTRLSVLGAQVWMTGADPMAFGRHYRPCPSVRGCATVMWNLNPLSSINPLHVFH